MSASGFPTKNVFVSILSSYGVCKTLQCRPLNETTNSLWYIAREDNPFLNPMVASPEPDSDEQVYVPKSPAPVVSPVPFYSSSSAAAAAPPPVPEPENFVADTYPNNDDLFEELTMPQLPQVVEPKPRRGRPGRPRGSKNKRRADRVWEDRPKRRRVRVNECKFKEWEAAIEEAEEEVEDEAEDEGMTCDICKCTREILGECRVCNFCMCSICYAIVVPRFGTKCPQCSSDKF